MIPTEYESYESHVTVACVNFEPIVGDKEATLRKMEGNIVEAALQGANVIAFPEEALVGASGCAGCRSEGAPCATHIEIAEEVPGPSTERIAELAAEHDVYVIFGMAEQDPVDPGRLYNAAAVVAPEGVQGTYRKLHLGTLPWVNEGITFSPGSELPVFETRYGPIGVQICFDFWFNPELTRLLALKGARLIVNCAGTFRGPGKREYMVHTSRTRAQENLVYIASANLVSQPTAASSYSGENLTTSQRESSFLGHSTIAGPAFPRFSHVYAEAGDEEEMVMATLSFERLHRIEAVFPWREWRRTRLKATSDLIAREFQNLY